MKAVFAGRRIVAVGDRGHIIFSDDEGATWRQGDCPVDVPLTSVFFFDDRRGWAVGHDAIILGTIDGGAHWTILRRAPELNQPLFDIAFDSELHGFAVGAFGLMLETSDGGRTWRSRSFEKGFDRHLYAAAVGNGSWFVVGEIGLAYRSSDGGRTWKKTHKPLGWSWFGVVPLHSRDTFVFGLNGHTALLKSDGTLIEKNYEDGTSIFCATVKKNGELMMAGAMGHVRVSHDLGLGSEIISDRVSPSICSLLETPSGRLLAFGETGVRVLKERP